MQSQKENNLKVKNALSQMVNVPVISANQNKKKVNVSTVQAAKRSRRMPCKTVNK
jgi:hypothetical protein